MDVLLNVLKLHKISIKYEMSIRPAKKRERMNNENEY
jgi:hypothetical protein